MIEVTLLGTLEGKFTLKEQVYLAGIPEKGDVIELEKKEYQVRHKRFFAERGSTNTEPRIWIFAELKP